MGKTDRRSEQDIGIAREFMYRMVIIDGYNVICRNAQLARKAKESLVSARNSLLACVRSWMVRTNFQGEAVVVYDGRSNSENTCFPGGDVLCIFTGEEEEADDRITAILRTVSDSASVLVISEDNKVINVCRAFKAGVLPGSHLMRRTCKAGDTHNTGDYSKKIHPRTADDITSYMKKRWGI